MTARPTEFHAPNRIVCYIDLLGFSEHVARSGRDELSRIATLLEGIREKFETTHAGLFAHSLSDSIFIYTVDDESATAERVVMACQDIFWHFLLHGFLARGGIATGPCIVEGAIAVGEPVVRAVKLESKVARFPRIVLGKKFKSLLTNQSFVVENIKWGTDGPCWVDTFSYRARLLAELSSSFDRLRPQASSSLALSLLKTKAEAVDLSLRDINRAATVIEEGLDSNQEDIATFEKFFWCAKAFSAAFAQVSDALRNQITFPEAHKSPSLG